MRLCQSIIILKVRSFTYSRLLHLQGRPWTPVQAILLHPTKCTVRTGSFIVPGTVLVSGKVSWGEARMIQMDYTKWIK